MESLMKFIAIFTFPLASALLIVISEVLIRRRFSEIWRAYFIPDIIAGIIGFFLSYLLHAKIVGLEKWESLFMALPWWTWIIWLIAYLAVLSAVDLILPKTNKNNNSRRDDAPSDKLSKNLTTKNTMPHYKQKWFQTLVLMCLFILFGTFDQSDPTEETVALATYIKQNYKWVGAILVFVTFYFFYGIVHIVHTIVDLVIKIKQEKH